MTTPAQLAANRRNARKSAGPTSDSGKSIAAQNALRHGLTAKHVLSEDERSPDFASFAAALRADLAPADEVEEQLAERIVLTSWRLRRIARAEPGLIATWSLDTHPDILVYSETPMARMFRRRAEPMTALSRYEASLDRALGRAYALLERRQALRRGESVPPPVTLLVEGIDSDAANPLARQEKSENYETNPISAAAASEGDDAPLDAAV
ncbi:MAG TPA: hypothetical protein VNF99_21930 [Stellaceae bacterium]|nr:hypothetical protein [Stellaceae bacterium]